MSADRPRAEPFPRRRTGTVRVDSVGEERAFLQAYPPPGGSWEVVSQLLVDAAGQPEDHLTVRSADGARAVVRFDVGSFVGVVGSEQAGGPADDRLDRLMQTALDFARENGPHHPGSLPRFPVPAEDYPGRVAVPLAILAVDDEGRRGLYMPPRVVVLTYPPGEPIGVGELPGFDPAAWPPPRLGDWPPAAVRDLDRAQLQGIVARFGACWARLLDAWLAGADYPQRGDEAAEALALLHRLDPPAMTDVYARLSPRFWRSLSL